MTVIKDGTGNGFVAEVNQINQLSVEAMTEPDVATGADLGVAWIVNGTVLNGLSGIERTVMIITNSGPVNVEIGLTVSSVQNFIVASGVVTTIKTYLGISTATGSAATPVNMNTQFATLPTVGIAVFAPTVTVSDTLVNQVFLQNDDSYTLDYQSSIVLAPGGSYRVTSTPLSTPPVSGYTVAHSVRFVNEFH